MSDLQELKGILYDLQDQVERLQEAIWELEANSPEGIARREAQQKYQQEHPELYNTFSPELFAKKINEQFRKKVALDKLLGE